MFVCVCVCVCYRSGLLHNAKSYRPQTRLLCSTANQAARQPAGGEAILCVETFPLSALYQLVQKPQHTHRSHSLKGAISADRAHQGQ